MFRSGPLKFMTVFMPRARSQYPQAIEQYGCSGKPLPESGTAVSRNPLSEIECVQNKFGAFESRQQLIAGKMRGHTNLLRVRKFRRQIRQEKFYPTSLFCSQPQVISYEAATFLTEYSTFVSVWL